MTKFWVGCCHSRYEPRLEIVWETISRQCLPETRMDSDSWAWKLFQGLFTQTYLGAAFKTCESDLLALSKTPNLLLISFCNLSPIIWLAQSIHASLLHFYSSSGSFCTVVVAFPPSLCDCNTASAATAYHHLPRIFGFLAELHHHVGILDDPKTLQSLLK